MTRLSWVAAQSASLLPLLAQEHAILLYSRIASLILAYYVAESLSRARERISTECEPNDLVVHLALKRQHSVRQRPHTASIDRLELQHGKGTHSWRYYVCRGGLLLSLTLLCRLDN